MRRKNDAYYSAEWLYQAIAEKIGEGVILDPCSGDGVALRAFPNREVITNDIDEGTSAQLHYDATCSPALADLAEGKIVVTNPPFNCAFEVLMNFFNSNAKEIWLLTRISFLEPTRKRGSWLHENPPKYMMVMPRYSFTGDGKTDSVTCCWLGWRCAASGIEIHEGK